MQKSSAAMYRATAVALVLHGIAFWTASGIRPFSNLPKVREVAIDALLGPDGMAGTSAHSPRVTSRASEFDARPRVPRSGERTPARGVVPPATVEPAASADAGVEVLKPPRLSLEQLGVSLRPGVALSQSDGSTAAPMSREQQQAVSARRALDSLRSDLGTHDIEVGLGPQDPVLRALESAVRLSAAALDGSATFSASVDPSGRLTDLTLLDAPPPHLEWERVARDVRKALRATTLRLPPGARGARIEIRLKSCIAKPSGCVGPSGGGFDVTDLGAGTFRLVQAHVIEVTAL